MIRHGLEPTIRIRQEAARMVFDLREGKPVKDVALEQKHIIRGSTGRPKD